MVKHLIVIKMNASSSINLISAILLFKKFNHNSIIVLFYFKISSIKYIII